ncbi:amino acid adenylation domain-containing protein [Streptomyces sp. JJ38]|uniref:amino acid adenylation domain-containing protein n=1 Tax=Streptomyces sp. JJ38 TaxID=2738128 RepID=UPI001C57803C|nr:amino acid adenylation domain-containing protein [Streptomyces sp. JJ38]MBW1598377.1 amino acid adenylation domain-containing protein [Streptomyces sp. JJ38]
MTDVFDEQVRRAPDAPALRFHDGELSYGELDEQADSLGRALRERGVAAEDVVGLAMAPSAALVTAMLGVLKAGAVYLPLALDNPPGRNAFLLEDSGAKLVVRDEAAHELFPSALEFTALRPRGSERGGLSRVESGQRAAYIMYTSGSTGAPKGVVVAHEAIRRLVSDQDYCRIGAGDVIPLAANTAFDAATFEVWGALANGACLVGISKDQLLSAPELEKFIAAASVTVMHVPMAVFHLHARLSPAVFSGVDQLLTGGEAADPALVRRVLEAGAPRRVLHMYGPTECTTFSTAQEIDEESVSGSRVPVGRPVAGAVVLILDERFRPVEGGGAGEIFIGGPRVAIGYHNRPALDRERFVELPGRAGRFYRTGDRGRWLADGTIDFLGRLDDQVKLHGMRVELGEVETVIRRSDAVADCAVFTVGEAEGRRLEAHVVFHGAEADVNALRRELEEKLPGYMLPRVIRPCPELPLNANGKVDRARLSAGHRP